MSKEKKSVDLVGTLEPYFEKAPALPKNGKDALVKYLPYIALVFGIIGILGAIGGISALTVTSPLAVLGGAEGISAYGGGFISALFWGASSVLLLAAFPGLKATKLKGWNLLFWSEVISIVGSLVSFQFLSAILGALIGFWLLFQVKSYYK